MKMLKQKEVTFINRAGKRAFTKSVRKAGISKADAEKYVFIVNEGSGTPSPPQEIGEGDKVRLNSELIKARKNYPRMAERYREFVEQNEDTVFTAHVERENMISMIEEPRWLFWSGDLIKADDTQ